MRRRHRRLQRAVLVIGVLFVAAGLGGVVLYRAMRPSVYRPGEDHQEITQRLSRALPADAPEPRFTDVTEAAGLATFRSFAGTRSSQLPEDMGAGMAWGDFDGDGDDDLFLVSAGGTLDADPSEWAPSVLYENLGGGAFVPAAGFPDIRIVGMGAAWGDADGDGRLDLAIAGYQTLMLLRNRVGGFEIDEEFSPLDGFWAAPSWADYDQDGDLDLYVTGYVRYVEPGPDTTHSSSQQYGKAVPYTLNPASFEAERNLLLQNDGTGRFVDVAEERGVDNPSGRSLSALWHDWNDDGRLDLYVANDISDNAFYVNREDGFSDSSLEAWVADYRGAMGLAAGDWNRDGDDDIFVTHWVAQENALYDSLLMDSIAEGRPPLLAFRDKAVPLGLGQIALPLVGWGAEFADFDADGWLDLIVANGSTFESDQEPRQLLPQKLLLMWSKQGEHFHDLAPGSEVLSREKVWRSLTVSDYDLDGDQDVAILSLPGGVHLLRNDMQIGSWLELRLRQTNGSEAPGATAEVTAGSVKHRRSVTSASYLSQSSSTLHFGLGKADKVEAIEVRWPSGEIETFPGVEANALYELVQGTEEARRAEFTAALPKREREARFWELQRAAMDAVKRENDSLKAIPLFREALTLRPRHEDSRYYLANCLAAQDKVDEAIEELEFLQATQPQSHRAFKRAGTLRALTATKPDELETAETEIRRALEINPEATGALLMLSEIEILTGQLEAAAQRLTQACQTNPRAVGGFFLRGYIAWKAGEDEASLDLLQGAGATRGEDEIPEGAVAEGDVARRMHRESSPLSRFWKTWDGDLDPQRTFAALDVFLMDWHGN
ncbi:MAG: tetratricopeptide repeat protein [bacterium]|nr:tetratricopeptide repeat protein [bacterium]